MENKAENGRKNNNGSDKIKIPKLELPTKLENSNYVDTAEDVVLHLNGNKLEKRFEKINNEWKRKDKSKIEQNQSFYLTTTKIRNLLSLLNVIRQMVIEEPKETINGETLGKIQYFKMRCAYESGRDTAVKDFIKKSNLMNYINDIGDSKKAFELFFHYVEALVAYHRFYGGNN